MRKHFIISSLVLTTLLSIAQTPDSTKAAKKLSAVTVTTQKQFIQRKGDKLIINVAASPVNAGQSAMDVLEKSPGVSIDENGNISLNGKQGVQIFIDNKMNYLAGPDLVNYLKALPASQLDLVEIMTQPSAKYDAAGNSGIINLKTKKNQLNGFNGNITFSPIIGYYFKNRDNITLNWKKNKLNVMLNDGFAYTKNFNNVHTLRSFRKDYFSNYSQYLDQSMWNTFEFTPSTPRLVVDYKASKNTTVGFGIDALLGVNSSHASGPTTIYDSLHHLSGIENTVQDSRTPVSRLGFNANIQHAIAKGKDISADVDYINYINKGGQVSQNHFVDKNGNALAPYLLNSNLPSKVNIFSIKSDFSQQMAGNVKLEAGLKVSYIKTDNDAQYTIFDTLRTKWIPDSALNNHFLYTENINAAYINLNKQFNKKWNLQLGLRAEQTNSNGNELLQNTQFKKNYLQLFPTAFLNYTPDTKNSFSASYGRRIDRPNYFDLNPFQFVIDQYTTRQGNPLLQPVFTHNAELSYNYNGQLDLVLNYTKTNGIITNIQTNVPRGNGITTILTRGNINSRRNIGLAANYNRHLKSWWNFQLAVDLFNNAYNDNSSGTDTLYNITVFRSNTSNQFYLKHGWTIDVSGFFLGRRSEGALLYAVPAGAFSLGLSKKFMHDKATVTMNLNDPFYTFKGPDLSTTQKTFSSRLVNGRENRILTATFNYKFGKAFQQRRRNSGVQDEQNRL